MVLLYILLLTPLITASRRFDGPSYRSNIMEDGKPILRMAPETDDADDTDSNTSDDDRQPNPPPETNPSATAKDMKQLVNWLLDNFSYDLVALGPKKNTDTDSNILRNSVPKKSLEDDDDDDKVINKFEDKESEPITESAVEASGANKETGLRTNKKKHKEKVPEWVADLKDYIKDLTTRYGQREVLEKTKPVIASLQKKHRMKIKDIDGEIHITYIEKGTGKKVARHSEER